MTRRCDQPPASPRSTLAQRVEFYAAEVLGDAVTSFRLRLALPPREAAWAACALAMARMDCDGQGG